MELFFSKNISTKWKKMKDLQVKIINKISQFWHIWLQSKYHSFY